MVGRRVVGLKAVKGVPVGGKAEGVGAGVGEGEGEGAGAAPDGAASLLTRTSSPPGKAWRSSVLKVPDAGSKTSSVEKLGLAAASCSGAASKVIAGLFRVKLSNSESKLKEDGRGGDCGDGLGVWGWGLGLVTAGCWVWGLGGLVTGGMGVGS